MKSTENRIAQAEIRTSGGSNPLLHPSGRYSLGIRLSFDVEKARPPYFITDATTGEAFDAIGQWETWAREANEAHRKHGAEITLEFHRAIPPKKGGSRGES